MFHDNLTQKFIQGENLDPKIYLQAIKWTQKFIFQPKSTLKKWHIPYPNLWDYPRPPETLLANIVDLHFLNE